MGLSDLKVTPFGLPKIKKGRRTCIFTHFRFQNAF
jgi:hypothetical protein